MADLSSYDVDFLQGMIAHHEEALKMSKKYLSAPASQRRAAVTDLATGIITAQTKEIKMMTGWLRAAGQPVTGAESEGMGETSTRGM